MNIFIYFNDSNSEPGLITSSILVCIYCKLYHLHLICQILHHRVVEIIKTYPYKPNTRIEFDHRTHILQFSFNTVLLWLATVKLEKLWSYTKDRPAGSQWGFIMSIILTGKNFPFWPILGGQAFKYDRQLRHIRIFFWLKFSNLQRSAK